MPEGTVQNIEIEAPPERVYQIAADVARYPEWAQGVRTVELLEEDEAGLPIRASFEIDGMMKVIRYELEYVHDAPHKMAWTAIPGTDIKSMTGHYEFEALDNGGTAVVYALRVDPSFTVPGFIRRQAERTIVGAALRGLKRRAEAEAPAR